MADLEAPMSHELSTFKRAFDRAVDLAGGVGPMASAIGYSVGAVSKMRRLDNKDRIPGDLFPLIDTAARYPCMLEASAMLAGYSIRREEVDRADMPICILAGIVAEDSGRAVRAVLEADADQEISLREFNCVEAEGKTAIANINRMIEAARAKHEAGAGARVLRMAGGERR